MRALSKRNAVVAETCCGCWDRAEKSEGECLQKFPFESTTSHHTCLTSTRAPSSADAARAYVAVACRVGVQCMGWETRRLVDL